ncbi:MAG: serine/threonine-protein kinase [Thermoanaerobaculia bacterium]|nr:serine/threonine-protein kinase [Thermoanaerobaculia bacterium]
MNLPPPDRLAEVDALFAELLELSIDERDRRLADHGHDPELVREVRTLLEYDQLDDTTMTSQVGWDTSRWLTVEPDDEGEAGERIGAYRLIDRIARGGMGVVWLGERADGAFEQRVALKLLPSGFLSASAVQRFERERQILAHLNHDNIARLLDGGVDPRGRPFLAMELVDGSPIDVHCNDRSLPIEARLRLLISAARAVQAAHGNLIVHCDLKPANILVTEEGVVKLLDFGVAELVGAGEAVAMSGEHRLLTPQYASPESLSGRPLTTVSDVYQLGLLAFELCCGRHSRPETGVQELLDPSRLEAAPTAPSLALMAADAEPSPVEIASQRQTTVDRLRRRLTGDLDAIILQALAVAPEDRYRSADDFANDLERFLDRRPVAARRLGWPYRARRLVQRHPALAVLAALLVLAAGGLVRQTSTAWEQRDRAESEAQASRALAEKNQEVSDFLVKMLTDASVAEVREDLTVAELLDRSALRAGTELSEESAARSEIEEILGRVYNRVGRAEDARLLLEDALARKRAEVGGAELADTILRLAEVHISLGNHQQVKRLLHEAIELQRGDPSQSGETAQIASTLSLLSYVHGMLGELEPMLALRRESLAIRQKLEAAPGTSTAQGLNDLCFAYKDIGDYEVAEDFCRQAMGIWRAQNNTDAEIGTLGNLSLVELGSGKLDEADRHSKETLDWMIENLPRTHPRAAGFYTNRGEILAARGAYGAAGAAFEEARELLALIYSPDHRAVARLDYLEARLWVQSGFPELAEPQARRALEVLRRTHDENQHLVLQARIVLAQAMVALGEWEQAMADLREVESRLRVGRSDNEMWLRRCRALLAQTGS